MSAAAPGDRLSAGRKLGYASGEFAFNLFWGTTTFFLAFYYTDVLGLPNAAAGLVALVPLVWDGIVDLMMGWLGGRWRTRWGRYRPFVLFGSLPLCLGFVLMFLPVGAKGGALLAFAMATHLLFRTCYGLVSIPFVSLSAVMTRDSTERGDLAAYRIVMATVSTLAISFLTLPLVKALGDGDARRGYFLMACLYAAVGVAFFAVAFFSTREETVEAAETHPRLGQVLVMLRQNRPLQIVAGATLVGSTSSTLMVNTLHYYFKYSLNAEAAVGLGLTLLIGAATLATPAWAWLAARTSKRTVYLAGAAVSALGGVALWAVNPTSTPPVLGLLFVLGLGSAAHALTFWSMLPDTVEFGEWRSGVRAEAMVFGVVVFAQKASVGLGLGLLGLSLDAIGYRANAAQGAGTLEGLRVLVTLVPVAMGLAAAAIMAFYPLDRQRHGELVRLIALRRSEAAGGGAEAR